MRLDRGREPPRPEKGGFLVKKTQWIFGFAFAALLTASMARADEAAVTVGLILPMTGPSASTGKQERAGAELYIAQHGDIVAGKKIALIVKDDTGAADVTKRLAQDLIGNDHASVKRKCRKSSPPRRPP
jgi:branched-chain amino acid transport system substrate-binding protein